VYVFEVGSMNLLRCCVNIFICLLVVLYSIGAFHGDDKGKSTVFATAWGETLSQDGGGFYNEIADDVLSLTAATESYQIRPYRRAKVSFFSNSDSCLYPSSLSALAQAGQIDDVGKFVESDGLFIARTHLFARAGDTPPKNLSDLFGKSVAYPNGSVARGVLAGHGARLISVNDEQDKAEMLNSGRVDIITGMIPDTAIVFGKMGGKMPVYEPSFALYEVPVTFVCHRTPGNEAFIISVNEALKALSGDDTYIARMTAATIAQEKLAKASGGPLAADMTVVTEMAPTLEEKTTARTTPSGRRLPVRANR